ncbi:thiamine biosynthesis protein ThiF [Chitinophaga alhagiae]|uniref:Thiamine biosynthesis protein ThiF n=1 Tax=Chitinophaga alhagiae TaxID=2203219 RepID=A0ABM6WDB3_9BACT|nr:HesA/MoeB/ThiF family protein [Chitinophaga alhagiae]AWO01886.1 thiamine biosynthesis protein ThiF [Chitinophaga alhagiae]
MNRYDRQIRLDGFGPARQELLKNAAVLVIGAGGLGVPVLQYLAAMGVGKLGIAEADKISVTNLHRQVLYQTQDAGKPKLDVAIERLALQNPDVTFIPHPTFITPGNALDMMAGYDVVADCSDNFATRYLVSDACVILGKPLVYGAIYGFEGQVSVFNYKGSASYRCLFPEPGVAPDCNTVGVLGVLPGIIGCYQANEVVKVICGIGEPLANQLLAINILDNMHQVFTFQPVAENFRISQLQNSYEETACAARQVAALSVQELQQWLQEGQDFQLLDVREKEEWDVCHIEGALHIPMRRVEAAMSGLPRQKPLAIICHHGMRSRTIAELLLQNGFTNVYNITGGIHAWAAEIDDTMEMY